MKQRSSGKWILVIVMLSLIAALIGGAMRNNIITTPGQLVCTSEGQIQQGDLPDSVPPKLSAIFTAAAKTWGVPPYALALVYSRENGSIKREPPPPYGSGPPWAISSAHAEGGMQIRPGTYWPLRNSNPAHSPGNVYDLVDASYAAAHYLSILGVKANSPFGDPQNPQKGTVIWGLGAYNAGPHSGFDTWQHHSYRELSAAEYASSYAGKSGASTLSAMVAMCKEQEDVSVGPVPTGECPPGSPASVVTMGNGTRIKVCRVNGMVVNVKIAATWVKLVQLAKADGLNLSGGGFRTASQQISLRKAHCGSSHFAVYQMSANACSPPTARPGTSNHEKALAVDLYNAHTYSSRVYTWMRIHGPPLGIEAHVPREPWHWSLGGH